MSSLPACLTAIVLLGAAASRVRALLADPSPALRSLCRGLGCLGLAFLVQAPGTLALSGRLAGVPAIVAWAGDALALAAVNGIAVMLSRLACQAGTPGTATRLRTSATLAAITVLGMLGLPGPAGGAVGSGPARAAYLAVYLGCLGVMLADCLVMAVLYVPRTEDLSLRTGLRLIAAASLSGMAYVACISCADLTAWPGLRPAPAVAALAVTAACAAGLQAAAGATAGAWARRAVAWAAGQRLQRDYRRLSPLWAALCQAVPEIALAHATDPGASMGYRLYRRVIGIHDGELALRGYRDPAAIAGAAAHAARLGLTGSRLAATLEAAAIASAVAGKDAGREPAITGTFSPPEPGPGLAAESAWLARVSAAYAHSPVIRRLLAGHASRPARPAARRVAVAVTIVFAPEVLLAVLFLAAGWHARHAAGLLWGLAAAGLAALWWRALVTARTTPERNPAGRTLGYEQRDLLITICAVLVVAGFAGLSIAGAPPGLLAAETATLAVLAITAILCRYGQVVSAHAGAAAAVATMLVITCGAPLLGACLVVPLVCWARVETADSTRGGVIMSAPLGALVSLVALMALRLSQASDPR